MQPPLLLAFLLAATGGGGPRRDIHSVSPYIRAIESNAHGVVLECLFPDVDDSIPTHRQSEKGLLALPPSGHPSVRLLEADFKEFAEGKMVTPLTRWSHDQPGDATDVPVNGRDLVRVKRLGVCRDLGLAEVEVFPRQDLAANRGQRYRLYRRIMFEIPYPPRAGQSQDAADDGGKSSDGVFEDIFGRILLNAPAPRSIRIPPDPGQSFPVYREIPSPVAGRVLKIRADGEGFFAVPLRQLEAAGVAAPAGTFVPLYDRGELQHCFVLQNQKWPEGAVVFYSRDVSPFSPWNALWLVPSATETIPPLETAADFHGQLIREATLTDRYDRELVFNPNGEANENQKKDWFWAAVKTPEQARGSSLEPFDFEVPVSDLSPHAACVEVAIRLITPKDKTNRNVKLNDYVFTVAGEEIPSASLSQSSTGTGADEHSLRVPIGLDEERRRDLRQSGGISIRVEAKEAETAPSGKPPENPLFIDYIEATYRHRFTLRDGELRIPLNGESGPWEIAVPEDWREKGGPCVAALVGEDRLRMRLSTRTSADGSLIRVAALPKEASGVAQELRVFTAANIREASFPIPVRGERLLSSERAADSLLITHPSLLSGLSPLVEWHKAQGARVEVVCTDEIYDVFGDGTLSPYAIREFLRYAFHNWQRPAPSVVVLIGDATWDYKGRFGNGIRNYVPGCRLNGIYPTDHWFVTFEGDDKLPEMMIGRIPVFDATTCLTVVSKITKGYAPPGPWRARALMLSDKEPEFVREIDDLLRGPYPAHCYCYQWLRLSDFPFADNFYHPEFLMAAEQTKHSPDCNRAIIRWLDRGVVLWDFHGHGAPNVLGHERIFFGGGSIYTDVKKLTNGRRYPLFIANTCDTARFDYAQEKWNVSLGEDLLQHPGGGCIAMFLHTGRGYPGQHRVIDRLFLDSMFRLSLRKVGQIFTAAKILYLLNPKPPEPLDMMVLIGDPLTPFPAPEETLKVTVSDSGLVRRETGALELGFETFPLDPDLADIVERNQYRAYAYVTGADHRILWEEEDLPLESSGIRREITLPSDAAEGEGRVGVYFYPVEATAELALPDAIGFATFALEVDPAIEEKLQARVQPHGKPNLRIASLVLEPTQPINGHTIWIHATLVNDGSAEARSIDVIGFASEEENAPRIQAWAPRREQVWTLDRLYPSESGTVRLRWDPFANAGNQILRVVVDPKDRIQESDETDNSATAEIFVRRKADLVMHEKLVAFGVKDGTPYVRFQFVNLGECPAEQEFRTDLEFLESPDSEPLQVIPFAFLWGQDTMPIPAGGFFRSDWTPVPEGAEWIEIVVDPDDIVDEETHQNNRILKRIEMPKPGS